MNANKGFKKGLLFCVFCLSLAISSCQWVAIEPVAPDLPPVDEEISFATAIQPIFNAKCIGCHNNTSPILTEGNAYNSLVNGGLINTTDPANSALYLQINTGHPGGSNTANSTERALILRWIEEGAQNN